MSSSSPCKSPELTHQRRQLLRLGAMGCAAAAAGGANLWLLPSEARAQGSSAGPAAPAAPLEVLGLRLRPRGVGQLRFFGLEIYTARLWTAEGFDAERHAQHPLALELAYARSFSAKQIAERSLQEMKRQTQIGSALEADWIQKLAAVLPDVKPGDRLLGIHRPQQGAVFQAGAQPGARTLGAVDDPQFSALFFGIWLSSATSEPGLRAALLSAT